MKIRSIFGGLVLGFSLLGAAPASATVLNYQINNGVFTDGSAFTGDFSYDTDLNQVTAFDVVTNAGVLPAFEYNASNSLSWMGGFGTNSFELFALNTNRYFNMSFGSALSSGAPQDFNYSSSWDCDNCGNFRNVSAGSISLVEDSVAGAVPEPATWAMMLVGFGAIGFSMRRRRFPNALQVA